MDNMFVAVTHLEAASDLKLDPALVADNQVALAHMANAYANIAQAAALVQIARALDDIAKSLHGSGRPAGKELTRIADMLKELNKRGSK